MAKSAGADAPRQRPMAEAEFLIHGTCIAFGAIGVLLRGRAGSGKSDLALRLLALEERITGLPPAKLIADDQVILRKHADGLLASCPLRLAGKIEARGVGILDLPHAEQAVLKLIADLVPPAQVPRLPPDVLPREHLLGVEVSVIKIAPFEPSAPLKLRLAAARLTDLAKKA